MKVLSLPRGMEYVSQYLAGRAGELHGAGTLVPCSYALLSLLLVVLQAGDSRVTAPNQQQHKNRTSTSSSSSASSSRPTEYLSSDSPATISYNDEVYYHS